MGIISPSVNVKMPYYLSCEVYTQRCYYVLYIFKSISETLHHRNEYERDCHHNEVVRILFHLMEDVESVCHCHACLSSEKIVFHPNEIK